jgi:hypothetical protein
VNALGHRIRSGDQSAGRDQEAVVQTAALTGYLKNHKEAFF